MGIITVIKVTGYPLINFIGAYLVMQITATLNSKKCFTIGIIVINKQTIQ